MSVFSSLSPQETYRMHGRLTRAQIENLLDQEQKYKQLEGIDACVSEAMAQFPAEDFLEDIKSRLNELSKKLRGDNREALAGIIESIDDLAQCTFYATDYGRSELNKVEKALEAIK